MYLQCSSCSSGSSFSICSCSSWGSCTTITKVVGTTVGSPVGLAGGFAVESASASIVGPTVDSAVESTFNCISIWAGCPFDRESYRNDKVL